MSTEAKHTEGLLKHRATSYLDYIEDEAGNVVATGEMGTADAERFVACWNAFDGLTTEQVERIGAGGVKEMAEALRVVRARMDSNILPNAEKIVQTSAFIRAILARIEGKP